MTGYEQKKVYDCGGRKKMMALFWYIQYFYGPEHILF